MLEEDPLHFPILLHLALADGAKAGENILARMNAAETLPNGYRLDALEFIANAAFLKGKGHEEISSIPMDSPVRSMQKL